MAVANRRKIEINKPTLNTSVKRKVGYETSNEDVYDTRRKFMNMTMNNK